jgi:hypothetical protein
MRYHIVCTRQSQVTGSRPHPHIVSVGTGTPQGYNRTWTVDEVIAAMGRGGVFYTESPSTGRVAKVEAYTCRVCGRRWIRTTADAVPDNNLDNLPSCA